MAGRDGARTMPTIETSLTEIQARLDSPEREWLQQRLAEFMEQMGLAELSDWRTGVQAPGCCNRPRTTCGPFWMTP